MKDYDVVLVGGDAAGLSAAGRSEVAGYGGTLIDDTVVGVEPGVRLASGWPGWWPTGA